MTRQSDTQAPLAPPADAKAQGIVLRRPDAPTEPTSPGNGAGAGYVPPGELAAPKFPVMAWHDIGFDGDNELRVEGIFPMTGLVCIYGGPGTVKSFVLLDLFKRIALGWPWGGRGVNKVR